VPTLGAPLCTMFVKFIFFFQQIVFPPTNLTCSLNATFLHNICLTCEKEVPSNSFGLLANGEAPMLRVLLC